MNNIIEYKQILYFSEEEKTYI